MLWDVLIGCEFDVFWCVSDHRVCAKWGSCCTSEVWVNARSLCWRRDMSASRHELFAEGTPKI